MDVVNDEAKEQCGKEPEEAGISRRNATLEKR